MPKFIRQSAMSTATVRVANRVAYLDVFQAEADAAITAYRQAEPHGTDYTLVVLRTIGRKRLEEIAVAAGKAFDTVKKDVGMWSAVRLCDMYPPERVETWRTPKQDGSGLRAATKKVPVAYADLDWVERYTPHRVTHEVKRLGSSLWRREAAAKARTQLTHFGVYDVWNVLLSSLPARPVDPVAYLRALASQASWSRSIRTPEDGDKKAALVRKHLGDDSPWEDARQLWRAHIREQLTAGQRNGLRGIGRFTAFQTGFNAFDGDSKSAAKLLALLKEVASRRTTPERAIELAGEYAEDEKRAFKEALRFSQCLHLARPDVFPFVTELQSDVIAHLAGFDADDLDTAAAEAGMEGRVLYVRLLPWLRTLVPLLELPDFNALDTFLLSFDKLFDEYGAKAYWDEIALFQEEVADAPEIEP